MTKLFKIELNKILYNKAFRVFFGIYVLIFFVFTWVIKSIDGMDDLKEITKNDSIHPYQFPDVWVLLSFIAQAFTAFLAIIIVVLVCNEFVYRTARQHIIDGLNRFEFVLGKFIQVLFVSLCAVLCIGLIGLLIGSVNGKAGDGVNIFEGFSYILSFGIQTIGFLTLAMMSGLLIKRSGVAIIAFLGFFTTIPNLLIRYKIDEGLAGFLPFGFFWRLIYIDTHKGARNDIEISTVTIRDFIKLAPASDHWIAIAYIGVLLGICYWLVTRKDLK